MKSTIKNSFKNAFTDNFSYKVVSLFIALILWMTILGRRDFTITRNIEVEFIVSDGHLISNQSANQVKVKVSGPRTALRRFIDSGSSQVISVDLGQRSEGNYEIEIPTSKLDVPFGVKIQSVQPKVIQLQVGKKVGNQ
jgi:YbbR domain-containing protein